MTEKQMSSPASRQVITGPIDNIGIPMWCFSLKVREYQGCSQRTHHCAAVLCEGS
jgi:hypothetical protein